MTIEKDYAVYVGSFQTAVLTDFHISFFNYLKNNFKKVVIVIGVTEVKGSKINPLNFNLRKQMILSMFPEFHVIGLNNVPTNSLWSLELDALLNKSTNESTVIFGNRKTVLNLYSGKLKTREIPPEYLFSTSNESSEEHKTEDFRKGIIHAYKSTYPKVHPTVDIALFKENKKVLLLGKKSNDNRWRLPGGFVDPQDKSYESAASRELIEECGNISFTELNYEISTQINDWRYKTEIDKIITTLYSTEFISGEVKPNDDLEQLLWFNISEMNSMMKEEKINPEHISLIEHLLKKYL